MMDVYRPLRIGILLSLEMLAFPFLEEFFPSACNDIAKFRVVDTGLTFELLSCVMMNCSFVM